MESNRILLLPAVAIIIFLSLYTWNQRTSTLDSLAVRGGLESSSVVLNFIDKIHYRVMNFWNKYVDLVNVREENAKLKAEVIALKAQLRNTWEMLGELKRLRKHLNISSPDGWRALGCRVIGGRMGPNSPLASMILSRGYLSGATPQTPIVTTQGMVGIILRSGPYTSVGLLLTDPCVRISVLTQRSRIQGILSGTGAFKPLELNFIPYNANLDADELLITSGLDDIFPKGLPVAQIKSIQAPKVGNFLSISAEPLADLTKLEEVDILVKINPVNAKSHIIKTESQ